MHTNNSITETNVIKSYEELKALFNKNGDGPFYVHFNFTPWNHSKQTTTTIGMLRRKDIESATRRSLNWDLYFPAGQEIVVTYGDKTPNAGLSYTLLLKKDAQFMTPKQSLSDHVILRYKDRLYEGNMESGEMTTNDGVKIEIERSDKVSLNDIAFYNNGTRTIGRPLDKQTIRTIEDNFDNVVILGKGVDVTDCEYDDMKSIRSSDYKLQMPAASFVIIAKAGTYPIKITAESEVELHLQSVQAPKIKGAYKEEKISAEQIKNIIDERLNEELTPKLNATPNFNKEETKSGLEINNLGNESSDRNNVNEEKAKTKSKNASCNPGCSIF